MNARTRQSEPHAMLTTEEAADYLGMTSTTLNAWRCSKAIRLPYVKMGGAVRYRKSELEKFIEAHTYE